MDKLKEKAMERRSAGWCTKKKERKKRTRVQRGGDDTLIGIPLRELIGEDHIALCRLGETSVLS